VRLLRERRLSRALIILDSLVDCLLRPQESKIHPGCRAGFPILAEGGRCPDVRGQHGRDHVLLRSL